MMVKQTTSEITAMEVAITPKIIRKYALQYPSQHELQYASQHE